MRIACGNTTLQLRSSTGSSMGMPTAEDMSYFLYTLRCEKICSGTTFLRGDLGLAQNGSSYRKY